MALRKIKCLGRWEGLWGSHSPYLPGLDEADGPRGGPPLAAGLIGQVGADGVGAVPGVRWTRGVGQAARTTSHIPLLSVSGASSISLPPVPPLN